MTDAEKLSAVKSILHITGSDEDALLNTYLSLASAEILSYLYGVNGDVPSGATMPTKYETTQIMAVVEGYSQSGAEGETTHNENGINRTFRNADMTEYIRRSVAPYVGVL